MGERITHMIPDGLLEAVVGTEYFRSRYGTSIEPVNLNELKTVLFVFIHTLIPAMEGKSNELLTAGKELLNPLKELVKLLFLRSKLPLFAVGLLNINKFPMVYRSKNISKAQKCLQKIQAKLDTFLDDNSVLFLPSFPTPAHYHYEFTPFLIPSTSFLSIFNILGYPVVQCPIQLSKNDLPIGFQVVASKGNDHLLLSCALELERAFGGWIPPNLKPGEKISNDNVTLQIS